ncbi:hypothetical protein B0A66_11915 [Flavobacterium hercynium]|uniref:Uncharacterized protein n=2 Tax=Flavobacterium hercynium TaxID=387094 RepID=A0A226HAR3_9FLAO|nr:hypothetical protein B0A66_11915 [Flavobacterium hercynium]
MEKNYDPDNDNCPEKEMVENLQEQKRNQAQNTEKFSDNSQNRVAKDKTENEAQKSNVDSNATKK